MSLGDLSCCPVIRETRKDNNWVAVDDSVRLRGCHCARSGNRGETLPRRARTVDVRGFYKANRMGEKPDSSDRFLSSDALCGVAFAASSFSCVAGFASCCQERNVGSRAAANASPVVTEC